jgi:hypothetical protein
MWSKFESQLVKFKEVCDKLHVKSIIFISPILYDIDINKIHRYIKAYNLDFRCATINPREKLKEVCNRIRIDIIDPEDYVRNHFNNRLLENNYEFIYFAGDNNHCTPVASEYIAEYLCHYFVKIHSK